MRTENWTWGQVYKFAETLKADDVQMQCDKDSPRIKIYLNNGFGPP